MPLNFFRQPIEYPHVYAVPTNTGIDSGLDLSQDGTLSQPQDAWGYGIFDPMPSRRDGDNAAEPAGDDRAAVETASFGQTRNIRVDYVLPSRSLVVKDSGVFWPRRDDEDYDLISASDHRMVWVEVQFS